jgi:Xaa-Pro aminopeptidase
MCLLLIDRNASFFVPRLESEHVKLYSYDVIVESYPEFPGTRHPMEYLKELFKRLNLAAKTIGVDSDGAPTIFGYRGPSISEIMPQAEIKFAHDIVEDIMKVKSKEEIDLIRESVKWGNLAHTLLQEHTKPGLTENEISLRSSMEATLAMVKTFGEKDKSFTGMVDCATVGFRGQVGKYSAYPHSLTRNAIIRKGDILVTGTGPMIGGYRSELERVMIVGKPTKEQERYFNLMCKLQEIAFSTIKPGAKCSDVDKAVTEFCEDNNLMEYWRHHTGHAIGIGIHEAPFFDTGDHTIIQPGMVFTVEPGIYIPGFAGFRHSDTVLVTETGMERLTYYPRDLESLTIKC